MHAVTFLQTCEFMAGCTAILSKGTEARKAGKVGGVCVSQEGAGVIYLLYSPFCSNAPLKRERIHIQCTLVPCLLLNNAAAS